MQGHLDAIFFYASGTGLRRLKQQAHLGYLPSVSSVPSSKMASGKPDSLHWLGVLSMSQKRVGQRSYHSVTKLQSHAASLPLHPLVEAVTKAHPRFKGRELRPTSAVPQCGHQKSRILPSFCSADLAWYSADSPIVTKWLLQIQPFRQTQQCPTEKEKTVLPRISLLSPTSLLKYASYKRGHKL